MSLPLVGQRCRVRPWTAEDLESLVLHADNPRVSAQLRDIFPYPYTRDDGRRFLAFAAAQTPPTALTIEVAGRAVGGVGVTPGSGNERHTAEIGYWLGEAYWGRCIAAEALSLMTAYASDTFALVRLQALPAASNQRSCRVLEKAGYVLEGTMRKSFMKQGVLHDQCLYAWVSDVSAPGAGMTA